MKRKTFFALVGAGLLAFGMGCGGGGSDAAKEREFPLNEEFTVGVNEGGVIRGTDTRLFTGQVTEDSRCPPGVECIQAGTVRLRVFVAQKGIVYLDGAEQRIVVSLSETESAQIAATSAHPAYTLALRRVTPEASQTGPPAQTDYRLTLFLTRVP